MTYFRISAMPGNETARSVVLRWRETEAFPDSGEYCYIPADNALEAMREVCRYSGLTYSEAVGLVWEVAR